MVSYRREWSRTIKASARVALLATAAACGSHVTHAQAATCDALSALVLPNTTITAAQSIPAGSYQPPGSTVTYTNLPAFCRVTATISPVPGSNIGIEVWLPTTTWNHKYQQSGNHGFGGTYYWGEMVRQIQRGYATGITNAGHTGTAAYDVSWTFGPNAIQEIDDFAWRAVHQLAEKAKLIIQAYYGRPQSYAYFNGCSDGGREGLRAAQMFPRDFNGIIAGSAVAYYTHAATEQLVATINLKNAGITGAAGNAILTLVQNAEIAACDKLDGVVDGLISDPRRCHFDPSALVCTAGQNPSTCITSAQANAIKANESTLRDPVTGRYVMSGEEPGSEFDAIRFGFTQGLAPFGIANYQAGLQDPTWNGSTFNLHTDLPILDARLGVINTIDPDLRQFKEAGGKLIQWHGWGDVVTTPGWTTKYYREVGDQTTNGNLNRLQEFYRLFMLPEVGHCGSGPGTDNIGAENQTAVSRDPEHDVVSALEAWVELRAAPDHLVASKLNTANVPSSGTQLQRLICPFPTDAVYTGVGDTNDPDNYVCPTSANRSLYPNAFRGSDRDGWDRDGWDRDDR